MSSVVYFKVIGPMDRLPDHVLKNILQQQVQVGRLSFFFLQIAAKQIATLHHHFVQKDECLYSKVCFIIVLSSPIERASQNSTYVTPQLTQIITPDSIP